MRFKLMVLLLFGVLCAGLVSPAAVPHASAAPVQSHVAATHVRTEAAAFDKTRFVAHLAVAAFLVHYIYKKYKEGKLGRFHIFTDIKAAIAALFAYHEMKVAYNIAKTSNSKTLQALVSPIEKLTGTLNTMASGLKHGDTSTISTANSQEGTLQSTASQNGFGYKDQQPSGFNLGF